MSIYISKKESTSQKKVIVDDMLLTVDMPTTAGSKMLDGYKSLLEAEAVTRLKNAGYDVIAKAKVGEFAIDLLGESSYFGAEYQNGILKSPLAEAILNKDTEQVVCLEVNGSVMRSACQNGLVAVKPTYGTVSRYGTIPVACSGETVSILSKDINGCKEVLDIVSGYDAKDGTSIPTEMKIAGEKALSKKNKVAVITDMLSGIDGGVSSKVNEAIERLRGEGIEVEEISCPEIALSRNAWNILMSAELCNNVSRYDGVKYGYRAQNFNGIDGLYTNSRTEAFGILLKSAILFGSETLSTDNYMKVYDKALRVRRVIVEKFEEIFSKYDAVITPACSTLNYTKETVDGDKYISFKENFYTAPASVSGLPSVGVCGIQLIGKAFSDQILLDLATRLEKGDK